jgi:hypothetical protein
MITLKYKFLWTALIVASFWQSGVKAIPLLMKTFSSETRQLEVALGSRNEGVNIDWSDGDQSVDSVFLNNADLLEISSNGCLQDTNCSDDIAPTLLHVVPKRPFHKGEKATLTVQTIDSTQKHRLYVISFRPLARNEARVVVWRNVDDSDAEQISRGLSEAREQGWLKDDLLSRCQQLVQKVEAGGDADIVAKELGISAAVVDRLRQLGGENVADN